MRPTPAQARRLQQAAALLGSGKAADALRTVRSLIIELPSVGKVQHLLALCLKANGERDAALRAFKQAEALDPEDAQLLANHANLLLSHGDATAAIDKYKRALAIDARHVEIWISYSIALLRTDSSSAAREAALQATKIAPTWPAAWHALGAAQRAEGDLDSAVESLRRAVSLDEKNPSLRLALGVLERLQGRATVALEQYRVAAMLGMDSAELIDARAAALLDAGDIESAIDLSSTLTERFPDYAPGQLMLAEILWEHAGSPSAAIDHITNKIAVRTANRPLLRGAVDLLLAARHPERALPIIKVLRSGQDAAELAALEAEAHWQSNDPVRALETLADAPESWRHSLPWRRTQVRMLLAARRPEHAVKAAMDTLATVGYDQPLLAMLGTAWRMTDDPREHWLCDYETLVKVVDLDVADWIAELADQLRDLHRSRAAPLRQSLRLGTQTAGNLLGRTDPPIMRLRALLQEALNEILPNLPRDSDHPFLTRNTGRSRFVGSWSAKLTAGGRHVNHFHQEGWLSSAFYVELPTSIGVNSLTNAGCLQFGQPDEQLRLGHLSPRHIVRPKVGRLVLFPSYFWHGTAPFDDPVARLTVAFDALPTPVPQP